MLNYVDKAIICIYIIVSYIVYNIIISYKYYNYIVYNIYNHISYKSHNINQFVDVLYDISYNKSNVGFERSVKISDNIITNNNRYTVYTDMNNVDKNKLSDNIANYILSMSNNIYNSNLSLSIKKYIDKFSISDNPDIILGIDIDNNVYKIYIDNEKYGISACVIDISKNTAKYKFYNKISVSDANISHYYICENNIHFIIKKNIQNNKKNNIFGKYISYIGIIPNVISFYINNINNNKIYNIIEFINYNNYTLYY